MIPFEALNRRPCRSPTCWLKSLDVLVVGPQLLQETIEKVNTIKQIMKPAQDR